MALELYLDLYSQPCRSVYIFAKRNNIKFDFKKISLYGGEQYAEEFGKINMIRKAPAMRDGDFCLAESTKSLFNYSIRSGKHEFPVICGSLALSIALPQFPQKPSLSIAIMTYLSEKFQTPDHWYPANIHKRARVNEYLSWQHTAIRMQGSKVFWLRLLIPKMLGEEVPKEKMAAALEDLDGSLKLIEEKFLEERPFVAGDEISLADLVAIVEVMQPVGSGLNVFEGRPKLSAWRDRVRAAIGPELFDETHQIILNAQEMVNTMDGSTLQAFKPKILRLFL
ncbi:glutathione S-transferase theta-1b isoform X1 [Clupea harengus]|uniref:glutathione transferase n=1 Tax=Clupea harengus TaxID=7950 RepID=A0A6P8EVN4_CLUHA|nr:glutathione S-transferase theta-1b isoform X1 [Clupea harengus]